MKRLFSVTIIMSLLAAFVFSTPVYSEQQEAIIQEEQETKEQEMDIHKEMESAMQAQEGAVAANDVLMEYFCKGSTEPIYPEYFSGRYIENNKLYVCYVGALERVTNELEPIFGELSAYVEYKGCNYSYGELEEHLSLVLINIEARGKTITGYGIDEKENFAYVYVDEVDKYDVEKLLTNDFRTQDSRISVEERGCYVSTATLYAGEGISIITDHGTFYATYGLSGTYNGQPAFITCGHDVAVNDTVTYEGVTVGTIRYVRCANEQSGDFSIGIINNTNTTIPTHKVGNDTYGYTTLTGGTINYPATGTTVSRWGRSSNISYGTIGRTEAAQRLTDSLIIADLIEVIPNVVGKVYKGDSGGPICSNGKFLGILSGLDTGSDNYFFTSYRHIAEAGFTAYASHQISSWSNYNASYHRGYCSVCRAYITELHSGFLNSSGTCTRCGYSGGSVAP